MLVLLAYEIYYEKTGTDKSDWIIQTSYALKYRAAYTRAFKRRVNLCMECRNFATGTTALTGIGILVTLLLV